jgi:POT family proton-dependent oligopeptide transporter
VRDMSQGATADVPKGHPRGLYFLFFTEMWERFSYYGMRGLLKLYMVNYLFVTLRQTLQGKTYDLPGTDAGVVGWSFIKSLLPAVSPEDIAKCVPDATARLVAGDPANGVAGLAADVAQRLATETCTASPNASELYGWYTGLVYLTPLLGGLIADRYLGQRKSVYLGGTLMAIGHFVMAFENWFFVALAFLIVGNGCFKPNISTQVGGLYPPGDPRRDGAFTIFYMGINLGAFLCNLVCGTLAATVGWHYGFGAAGVGMVLGLIIYSIGQKHLAPDSLQQAKAAGGGEVKREPLTSDEWKRVGALIGLCALNVVFWAVYEQQGNTMQTWADENTAWPVILGFQIPSTWFQSFNPAFIFILAPLFDMLWRWQAKRDKEPSSVAKMAIGCFLLGISFIVMVVGAQLVGSGKGSLLWPVVCTLMLTVGELYLSPIGLSLVTKVSPARIVSMMMGMWFLSSFAGNILSGKIGRLYTSWSHESFFLLLMALGCGTGVAMWAFSKPLKRAMAGGAKPESPPATAEAAAG